MSAIAPASHGARVPHSYRRFTAALALCVALPSVAMVSAIVAIDPYYLFGTTGWHGINVVRPRYEPHVIVAKPYQVARLRPEAASFGSSRVEVGIDPRHPGWRSERVFNFALPSSNSYAVMLAFVHAQSYGLKRAIVGLDFFAYNINFPLATELSEEQFARRGTDGFADYLDRKAKERDKPVAAPPAVPQKAAPEEWNEALYRAVNPDVAAAIARQEFTSGRQHYELAGRAEKRLGAFVPPDWNEAGYLQAHPDVAHAVSRRNFLSGYHHYRAAGQFEGRLGGYLPADWNETEYLAFNPAARARVAFGIYRNGYIHYAAAGRKQGLIGGMPSEGLVERLSMAWPALHRSFRAATQFFRVAFSTTALRDALTTVRSQHLPASFDGLGMRVWHGQESALRAVGGAARMFDIPLRTGGWRPLLVSPKYNYCFENPATGVSMFDPYRFMLREAYAAGTDLRLYTSPLNAVMLEVIAAIGLSQRYEFWLRELTRINEEEAARAGRAAFPLWDFSDANSITREPYPVLGDLTPMRWHWEYSHYRKITGDLILDRLFSNSDPARPLPADFGVRLTGDTIEAHITHSRRRHEDWAAANETWRRNIAESGRKARANYRLDEAACW